MWFLRLPTPSPDCGAEAAWCSMFAYAQHGNVAVGIVWATPYQRWKEGRHCYCYRPYLPSWPLSSKIMVQFGTKITTRWIGSLLLQQRVACMSNWRRTDRGTPHPTCRVLRVWQVCLGENNVKHLSTVCGVKTPGAQRDWIVSEWVSDLGSCGSDFSLSYQHYLWINIALDISSQYYD